MVEKIFGPMVVGSNYYATLELYHRKEAEGFRILRENAEGKEGLSKAAQDIGKSPSSLLEVVELLKARD